VGADPERRLSWFGDPRSVYFDGAHRRTSTGWVSMNGSIQVGSDDHDTGLRTITTLRARLQIDDHNNPSILIRPDGRLLVFWSTHTGPTMRYRRKAWVHDIALDNAGRPVIVYATFPSDTDHRYRYVRWNGSGWTDRELVRAGRPMSIDPGSRRTRAGSP
jgi:hypothetical protein